MINPKILLAIVLPIVLVIGGGGFYYAAFHSAPEKPVVKLPTKYAGNIYIFDTIEIDYTYHNDTPLAKYWEREYLKMGHIWTISTNNINLTIKPYGLGFVGVPSWMQDLSFNITLKSSTYVEKVKIISDATYIEKLGNVASTVIIPSKASEKYVEKTLNAVFYNVTVFKVQRNNISLSLLDVVHIDSRDVNKTVPYNFTAYIETRDKIYEMKFVFNLTNQYFPLLNLWTLYHEHDSYYIPGATYFCYNSTWGKVVITDHLVAGTQYYFVEKNGVLSRIWSPYEVRNGW